MLDSDILAGDAGPDQATLGTAGASYHSTSDCNDNDKPKFQIISDVSSEPQAESTRNNISLNHKEQAELDQTLFLNEQVIELQSRTDIFNQEVMNLLWSSKDMMENFLISQDFEEADQGLELLQKAIELHLREDNFKAWLCSLADCFQEMVKRENVNTGVFKSVVTLMEQFISSQDPDIEEANVLLTLLQSHSGEASPRMDLALIQKCQNDLSSAQKGFELLNRGLKVLTCAKQSRDISEVDNALKIIEEAIQVTPDTDGSTKSDYKLMQLQILGDAFHLRSQLLDDPSDIEKAISLKQSVVDVTSDGHAEKGLRLMELGIVFTSKFDLCGELNDIGNAISLLQQAVDLTSNDDPNKPYMLSSLGSAFQSRCEHQGEPNDAKQAIILLEKAVSLTHDNDPNKASRLKSLGSAFELQFDCNGEISNIDNAIVILQKAADLTPDGHPYKASCLNNVGSAFQSRFEQLGEFDDIERAIDALQKANDLTPSDHAQKALIINNLGIAFQSQFEHLGQLNNIERATSLLQKAVDFTSDNHFNKPSMLSNLGNAFQSQFEHLRQFNDIEKSIDFLQRAVDLTPDDHAKKPLRLKNLGRSFQLRFEHFGELEDIKKAISIMQKAIVLTPNGHVNKAYMLSHLGTALQLLWKFSKDQQYYDQACSAYQEASLQSSGPPYFKLEAAIKWAEIATSPDLAMTAYERVFELIPQVVWLGQAVSKRYKELPGLGQIINAAVATAISDKNPEKAAEWLEEGRSIVWSQVLQLRSPLDHLYQQHPEIAKELEKVSQALDNAVSSSLNHTTTEEEAAHHTLASRYDDLIAEVRKLDGFDCFMKPKKLSQLASAGVNGPVIMINVHRTRCDALALCPSEKIIPIPLPHFSSECAQGMLSKLTTILYVNAVRLDHDEERVMHPALSEKETHDNLKSILADLWFKVVHPILAEIKDLINVEQGHLPHITWCATGPLVFLPLHAAGIYETGKPTKISDFAVSSYTTTLTALLTGIHKIEQNAQKTPDILIISQPNTPGYTPLPGTLKEVDVIQKHASPEHVYHITHEEATIEAVTNAMSKYSCIHFACHGIQDLQDPLDSAFALYDARLKLKVLMKVSLKNARLAFLSACQTATGDGKLPEEAVHLAAGMLAIGYPSIIATMWSIGDKEAPVIADKVYECLLSHHGDSEDQGKNFTPAYALHKAVKHLQEEVGETKFLKWVPFVHFGA
ncbi:hypothetical protein VKT23_012509 [Stygiomarasmius scandens]|uniref:CHAT domain-containing protein n=1 Tax=Marasmiellus scandens TaxID=2682957 RepID=A0ABR1JA06_9AGAR